jgi:hypothetical protein
VLRPDPELLASLDDRLAEELAGISVVQSPEILRRFRDEVLAGVDLLDADASTRIRQRWQLAEDPGTVRRSNDRP